MAQSVIGALRVTLGADTAQFERSMTRAQSQMARVSAGLKSAAAAASVAVGAAAAAMSVAMSKVIDDADNLAKTSQKIGVPVAELSRLQHAADLSGVSLGSLTNAMGRLSANMFDLSQGVGQAAARAFDQIGVSATNADGSLKGSQAVMLEVADRFSNMEDGAEKTAVAMAIFGKSGRDLIPMLNAGSAGIAEMKNEADSLGIVIDQKTGRAAEQFNDNMDRLAKVFRGLVVHVSAQLLPTLVQLSGDLLRVGESSGTVKKIAEFLTQTFRGLTIAGMELSFFISRLGAEFAALGEAVSQISQGNFSGAFDAYIAEGEKTAAMLENLRVKTSAIWNGVLTPQARISQGFDALNVKTNEAERSFAKLGETVARKVGPPLNLLPANFAKVEAATEKTGQTFDRVGNLMESSFSSSIDQLIDGTFNARDALTALLKDITKLILSQAFQSLLGGAFGGGLSFSGFFAKGDVFNSGGVTPFAKGGVVNAPTLFPFANGIGLMGEAGPEAVMPLRRDGAGNLGVAASGLGSQAGPMELTVRFVDRDNKEIESKKAASGGANDIEIFIDQVVGRKMAQRGSNTHAAAAAAFGLSNPLAGR